MLKRWSDLTGGIAFLGLGGLFWAQTIEQSVSAGTVANNPVWFPRLLLIIIAIGSLGLIAKAVLAKTSCDGRAALPAKPGQLALGVLLVGLYLLHFTPVGFLPTSAAMIIIFCLMTGYRSVVTVIVFTLIFVPGIWYLFVDGFSIRPPGIGMDNILSYIGGFANE
ncbi:tripartite tricarboxylate transporter TctB family protein [Roseinatronobacter alkalisoli]|uniref:Tripartite tricarboxylate transporter TctB family protein n=1 Tax=Roseinatronobacter alkalisoli TaxID=3028235 RepID=A0ABT5TEH9_9RHOB|nr:tripartite tricarboxylate transporter TctB family protein [Roseinatronobacter sp. HJB301]MDD7973526.1 tripartite tricarboxylate transporter TctB family protein [Roseinatronobacter sp. HJB301]